MEKDFLPERWRFVASSQAQYVFTQHPKLQLSHPNLVRFRYGVHNGTGFDDPNLLHYTNTSTYMALCLAIHMGAKLIGMIGVDYTPNHFFGVTGRYRGGTAEEVDPEFRRLCHAAADRGVKIYNLSSKSLLRAFPGLSIDEFAALPLPDSPVERGVKPLHIVSYSVTPVAGAAPRLSRCINVRTPHYSRCVWAAPHYANQITHPGDIDWSVSPSAAQAELSAADVVILHNGKTDVRHRPLLANKAIVTMAHNYISNVDQSFLHQGFPGAVVGQYQATLPEFERWPVVPQPIPIWEEAYQPGEKNEVVTICYTPSSKQDTSPRDRPFFWHSKGYPETMRILEKLEAHLLIRFQVIRDTHVSHSEAMAMKRQAHIVIDECVTGSYHASSLEGLATGCVVVNGVGLLPGVPDLIRHCTRGEAWNPFVFASLGTLEDVLASLIRRGPEELAHLGAANRHWMERYWDFGLQWESLWMPVIDQALQERSRRWREETAV